MTIKICVSFSSSEEIGENRRGTTSLYYEDMVIGFSPMFPYPYHDAHVQNEATKNKINVFSKLQEIVSGNNMLMKLLIVKGINASMQDTVNVGL